MPLLHHLIIFAAISLTPVSIAQPSDDAGTKPTEPSMNLPMDVGSEAPPSKSIPPSAETHPTQMNATDSEHSAAQKTSDTLEAQPVWHYAGGINSIWSRRSDYGARYFYRFEPEISGMMYSNLPVERLWLRHGARVSYSSDQPQMPQAMRIEETDWKISVEEGIVYSWFISPSIAAGLGYDWRTIKHKTEAPVLASDSRLNSKESFFWSYIQAGCGISMMAGKYMFEPIVRWQHLTSDARTKWAYGLEITAAW